MKFKNQEIEIEDYIDSKIINYKCLVIGVTHFYVSVINLANKNFFISKVNESYLQAYNIPEKYLGFKFGIIAEYNITKLYKKCKQCQI